MMVVNMANDAAHVFQLRGNIIKLALFINMQMPDLLTLSNADVIVIDKESWVGAVGKIFWQAVDGNFVFVRFSLPRTELRTVATLVAVSI